ncbi:MAG: hypothetical protein LBR56_03785 [Sporomusaceae bacterium]|jgi:hypothetical protein|nr:hypothetical protein [Sporomusaceae bacterium]
MKCQEKKPTCHTQCLPDGNIYFDFSRHLHCQRIDNDDHDGNGGTEVAEPKTIPLDWYVAKTGSDETGDGSQEKPFLTIQKGVDELGKLPLLMTRYNLHVGDGTYLENVEISQRTFNLIGNVEQPQNVIVQGVAKDNATTLFIDTAHLNINGFTFKSHAEAASFANTYTVTVWTNSDIRISNCIFYSDNASTLDLDVAGHSSCWVDNIVFEGPERAVVFTSHTQGHLVIGVGISIDGNTTVRGCLMNCYYSGSATVYELMTKTGTITGKQFYVHSLGQLSQKANLPATTVAGTDDRSNGAFAV